MLCNNHFDYIGALRKDHTKFHAKKNINLLLYWNTLQHWRECLPPVECYKTVFRWNGLDLNGYFEDCKSENTRANHPYKMQTKSAKVNSLKYSFFVKIIKDWNNLPNHLFTDEIRLSNFLSMQNEDNFQSPTNHKSADKVMPLGGSRVFFPKKILKSEKLCKAISSVLRGQFCLKCSLNHTNRLHPLPNFICMSSRTINYSILITNGAVLTFSGHHTLLGVLASVS